ncbi:hypothetical protein NQ317_007746 [Molorchus minor]|uniref:Ion transport domain-containing protein n=1 Tax=Molorchus minor TaxID=1323400 RepID=A0ABQ9JUQ0_9CUCU|nr:hypothetical protein NQ317_007746 [Molorchus minor]
MSDIVNNFSVANTILVWFCLDYIADFLYLVDIMFHFRTGYLEDGVLQTDATKLRHHYMNSTTFYIDCLCLLPLDFLYLSVGFNSILRSFRLVKIYRFWAFMDRTERHTNYPNLFRSSSLIHYLLVIFHWNGCLFHIILKNDGFGSKNWVYSDSENTDYVKAYLQSYYWCTLALTTIGDLPRPRNKGGVPLCDLSASVRAAPLRHGAGARSEHRHVCVGGKEGVSG